MLTSKKNIDNITEKSIENKIKKYLIINKIYHYKVHGNGFQRSGIPDIIACVKGRFVGIEVKFNTVELPVLSPGNKLETLKKDWIQGLINSKVTFKEFQSFIEEFKETVSELYFENAVLGEVK